MDNGIRNIIFDMGGVLIQWRPQKIADEFSPDPQVRQILTERVFGDNLWKQWDRGEINLEDVKQGIMARTGFRYEQADHLMALVLDSLDLIQPSLALLQELHTRGYHPYCLSNMPREHYEILKERLPVWQYFKGEVISGMVGIAKPDAAIFQHLLDKYQLTPETCLFLDDFPQNVEAAQALGINGFIYTDAAAFRQQMPQLLS